MTGINLRWPGLPPAGCERKSGLQGGPGPDISLWPHRGSRLSRRWPGPGRAGPDLRVVRFISVYCGQSRSRSARSPGLFRQSKAATPALLSQRHTNLTMHIPNPTRSNARQFLFRGLIAGLLLTQTVTLRAQTTTTEEKDKDETVVLEKFTVVAGFAGSLAAAAEMKQNQRVITEVIASEDIGKLPDISIADALTRLTGLTTQRGFGCFSSRSLPLCSGRCQLLRSVVTRPQATPNHALSTKSSNVGAVGCAFR